MTSPRNYERLIDVFNFIVEFKIRTQGMSPALRDIIGGTDITSTSVANYYLDILEEYKLIERIKNYKNGGRHYGIRILGEEWSISLPDNLLEYMKACESEQGFTRTVGRAKQHISA